jgi:predicted alpha/beta-fold hydrolase
MIVTAADVIVAPVAGEFRPLPLLRNAHVQTVLGQLLPGPRPSGAAREHVVWLSDGDALVMQDNVPPAWRMGDPVGVVIHGLSGSHASAAVRRMACWMLDRGLRVIRPDMRGVGRGLALARRPNHAGRSDDLRAILEAVHRISPASPLLVAGISLGGAIALRLAGETAGRAVPGLARLAALGPPVDLIHCATLLGRRRNWIYDQHFARGLVAEARMRQRQFPDLPPLRFPRRMTVRLFDDLYTAPRSGFANSTDYYHRAAALPLLGRIEIPTLILTARDDPFIAVEPLEQATLPASVELHALRHGGHLGFVGWDGAGGIRWAERRVVDWLLRGD